MAYQKKIILKNAVCTYPGERKKAKWPFFSVQQSCICCNRVMHGSTEEVKICVAIES